MKHRHTVLIAGLVVIALAVALTVIAAAGQDSLALNGTTYYVDADATGVPDGMSWGTAFTTLQPALDAVVSGDQIWVAEGTYTPTIEHGGTGDRYKSFQMVNGVAIYGGFDGTETELGQRDWEAHPTILSGDIGTEGDSSDNSYHVFYHPEEYIDLDSSAVLDGFIITAGNANGGAHYIGGGMYNDGSSPELTNCAFEGNYGDGGGGMYNSSSSPTLTNCIFSGNSADGGGGGMYNAESSPALTDCTFSGNSASNGGGMYNSQDSAPTLTNCTFEGNSDVERGGGMYNQGSSPVLTNCTFSGNSAGWGGGMNNSDSSPTLTDCTFSANSAEWGGGMWNRGSSPTLSNCNFESNSAFNGGGMVNYEFSSPTLTNCTFEGNSASSWGGGMCNGGSSPTLINCAFSGNSAQEGGGMYNASSSPTLTNCTFWSNSASFWAGGMYNRDDSSPTLTNCILWADTPDEIYNTNETSSPVVTYSDIQGGYPGEGNIDTYPFFVDAASGDFHLGPCSRCIDAGNNEAPNLPLYDFEGDDRKIDGDADGTATVDMGVDEVAVAGICYPVHLPVVLRNY